MSGTPFDGLVDALASYFEHRSGTTRRRTRKARIFGPSLDHGFMRRKFINHKNLAWNLRCDARAARKRTADSERKRVKDGLGGEDEGAKAQIWEPERPYRQQDHLPCFHPLPTGKHLENPSYSGLAFIVNGITQKIRHPCLQPTETTLLH